jgi:hypothetical protein
MNFPRIVPKPSLRGVFHRQLRGHRSLKSECWRDQGCPEPKEFDIVDRVVPDSAFLSMESSHSVHKDLLVWLTIPTDTQECICWSEF